MIPTIITLVITMVVDGRDYERHQPMASIEQCWVEAKTTMENIRASDHKDISIRNIGVGCVINTGDPA